MKVRLRMPSLGPVFGADAKAAGQTVRIGGWECRWDTTCQSAVVCSDP